MQTTFLQRKTHPSPLGPESWIGPRSTLFWRAPVHSLVLLRGSTTSTTTCGYALVLANLWFDAVRRGTSWSSSSRTPWTSVSAPGLPGRPRGDGHGVAWLHATPGAVPSLSLYRLRSQELPATTEGESSRALRQDTRQDRHRDFKCTEWCPTEAERHVHGVVVSFHGSGQDVEDQVERQTVPSPRRVGTEEESESGAASERTPPSLCDTSPRRGWSGGGSKKGLCQDVQGPTPSESRPRGRRYLGTGGADWRNGGHCLQERPWWTGISSDIFWLRLWRWRVRDLDFSGHEAEVLRWISLRSPSTCRRAYPHMWWFCGRSLGCTTVAALSIFCSRAHSCFFFHFDGTLRGTRRRSCVTSKKHRQADLFTVSGLADLVASTDEFCSGPCARLSSPSSSCFGLVYHRYLVVFLVVCSLPPSSPWFRVFGRCHPLIFARHMPDSEVTKLQSRPGGNHWEEGAWGRQLHFPAVSWTFSLWTTWRSGKIVVESEEPLRYRMGVVWFLWEQIFSANLLFFWKQISAFSMCFILRHGSLYSSQLHTSCVLKLLLAFSCWVGVFWSPFRG